MAGLGNAMKIPMHRNIVFDLVILTRPPFISDRPKLGEWWARIEKRPSFKAAGIVKEPLGLSTLAKKLCTIL